MITATVCLITLVIWEWFRKEPIIDVRMFKSFNFAAANLMMFMMGFMLFSTLVLIPEFLQTLMGYTAELAGLVLSGGGVVLLVMMPIVGRLTSKIQARWLIATGWLCLAIGLFYCAHQIDLFVSFRFAMWLRVAQVIGIGFLFVPITAAGYIGVPEEKGNSVSGMINFMRNIGGSIGTSVVTTMIARRAQYHQQILVGHITPDSPAYRSALHALSAKIAHSGLRAEDAHNQAIARFYELVHRQGGALSYMDIFWILGASVSLMFVLAFFLKKNDPGSGRPDVRRVRITSMIQAVSIEREFGCGGSEIAAKLAQLLGWKSVGPRTDAGNRATDPQYAASGRAEGMEKRSCGIPGLQVVSSRSV